MQSDSSLQRRDENGMEVRNDKNYYKPKLKRIMYRPFGEDRTVENSREKDQIVMVDAYVEKKDFEEAQEERKEKAVTKYLTQNGQAS